MRFTTFPEHLTVDSSTGKADCKTCQTGLTMQPTSPLAAPILDSFVIDHATHDADGRASGLTSKGNPRAAALAVLGESR